MKRNLETICIHGGWQPKKGEPQQLPIYQSTTFRYETSEQMARLFDLEDSGYFYTRLANPTNDAVAKKIAALEGGVGAVLTSSGQAANFYAIINICTFATPINCRPFEWGCDIVTHSTTKYMDGHASQVGGVVVDSGNFDWEAYSEKFQGLTTPDESYHGLVYTKSFGKLAYITKLVTQLMRDLGSIPAPQNSYLLNIGLETLHLRMRQHCDNAQKVAEWLEKNEKVAWVNYCGLPSDKYYALGQKYLPNGSCGVIAFGLKGSREDAIKFMDRLDFVSIVTHVADARTCVLHPASHTHRQLTDEQLREAGVAPDLIRLSVGIENVDDIIADLEQALK